MRIEQCYISKSVHDFPFCRLFNLTDYVDSSKPCIFFGCYRPEDADAIQQHKGLKVIWWCGMDALTFREWDKLKGVHHVTERVAVYEHLTSLGFKCKLNPCSNIAEDAEPGPLGRKVFAYCPSSYKQYHGIDVINELKQICPFEIIVGDGSINQNDWRAGACEEYYSQCFIGLVLSDFAGGGATVIELGLRGMKCVTNVVDLGNVINWKTTEDVMNAILEESKFIGHTREGVALQTVATLDLHNTFLNLSEYE